MNRLYSSDERTGSGVRAQIKTSFFSRNQRFREQTLFFKIRNFKEVVNRTVCKRKSFHVKEIIQITPSLNNHKIMIMEMIMVTINMVISNIKRPQY